MLHLLMKSNGLSVCFFYQVFPLSSTSVLGLMKNLILATESVVSRVGFFVRAPPAPNLFDREVSAEVSTLLANVVVFSQSVIKEGDD